MKAAHVVIDAALLAELIGLNPGDQIIGATQVEEGKVKLLVTGDLMPEMSIVETLAPGATIATLVPFPIDTDISFFLTSGTDTRAIRAIAGAYSHAPTQTWMTKRFERA